MSAPSAVSGLSGKVEDPCSYYPAADVERTYACYFGSCLKKLEEPRYQALELSPAAYRFLWVRANHRAIVVRVTRARGEARLDAKRLSGTECAGELDSPRALVLPDGAWEQFVGKLEQGGFWADPPPDSQARAPADGGWWVFEGWDGQRYRVLHYWTDDLPEPGDLGRPARSPRHAALREAALLLLEHAGMKPRDPAEIY